MIAFECPWCDHEVALLPMSFLDGSVVCAECRTRIDVAVGPAQMVTDAEVQLRSLRPAA